MDSHGSSELLENSDQGIIVDSIDLIQAEYLDNYEDEPDATLPDNQDTRIRVKATRKKQFRWTEQKDLDLTCEAENLQPFLAETKKAVEIWKAITTTINEKYASNLDYIGVQRRFTKISKDFSDEDMKNRYRSGIEETITTLKVKLANISALIKDQKEEQKGTTEKRQKKIDQEKAAAEEIRGSAFETFKRKATSEPGPSPKRVTDSSLIDLWTMKQTADQQRHEDEINADREFKLKKFQVKEDQLELDRQKFEHQKRKKEEELKLKKEEFELEKEERRNQLATQKILIELLAKKLQ